MLSCFPVDFSIPIEILFVVFADGAQHTAWISYRHYVSRNVLCHNASRTDHRIIPNGNTRHHDHASSQPTVATDADGQIVLVCFLTQVSPKLA